MSNNFLLQYTPKVDGVDLTDLGILCEASKGKANILEIGTRYARTTINLAHHCSSHGRVTSIDLNQEDALATLSRVPKEIVDKITLLQSDSSSINYSALGGPFDLIFIDGDHSTKGVLRDSLLVLPYLSAGGEIFWHDYTCLDVLVGIKWLGLEVTQRGSYLGYSKGKKANVDRKELIAQYLRVAEDIKSLVEQESNHTEGS